MGSKHAEFPSPGVAALIGFVAQANPARFESTSLFTPSFGFNPGDARDRSLVRGGEVTTPPFVGPCCRSVGA